MPNLFLAVARSLLSRTQVNHPAFRPGLAPEALERRTLMAVSLDANGFTVLAPEPGSRVVYVSSSLGDDANDGLSPAAPVKTLDRGESLLRDGSPDQLLLARGDVWRETLGEWTKSGRGVQEPMLIGAYGAGARPRLETGTRTAFSISSAKSDVAYVSLIGLHLVASARVPGYADFIAGAKGGNGLRILSKVDNLFVEDSIVQAYEDNILLQDYNGAPSNVTIRRSIVVDAYTATGGNSQGLYAYGVNGLVLEGNLFDHNGWSESVPGAPATVYNHNIYLASNTTNVIIKDNVIANAASHGLQARGGGRIENNVFIDNPIGLTFGVVKGASVASGGVSGVINGNVFLGTRTINGAGRGKGIEIGNTRPNVPTVVSNNIFAHADQSAGSDYAMLLSYVGDTNGEQAAGLNDLTVQGNIVYRWSKGLKFDPGFVPGTAGRLALNRVTIRGNDFQQVFDGRVVMHDSPLDRAQEKWEANRYDVGRDEPSRLFLDGKSITFDRWAATEESTGAAAAALYADAARSADTYALATLGIASRPELLGALRSSSSQSWRPQFAAPAMVEYVRAGYAEAGVAPRDWRAPSAPIAVATPPGVPTAGDAVLTFTVTYGDDKALDLSSLDAGDVRLRGRRGRVDVPAWVVSVQGGAEGQPAVVTYAAAAPDGSWDRRDKGKYALVAQERQVFDADGFFAAAGELASFKLKVAPRAKAPATPVDRPPRVVKATFSAKGTPALTAWFSEDVAGSISVDDLWLASEDGATVIDPSLMTMTYDPARRAATWVFGALPANRYRATLLAPGVTDAAGNALDGNRDGASGGDYSVKSALRA